MQQPEVNRQPSYNLEIVTEKTPFKDQSSQVTNLRADSIEKTSPFSLLARASILTGLQQLQFSNTSKEFAKRFKPLKSQDFDIKSFLKARAEKYTKANNPPLRRYDHGWNKSKGKKAAEWYLKEQKKNQ